MKNMKFWRTALVATLVLTIMLSVTGGTIAWFTDEVTSAANVIEAGNLDVKLSNAAGEVGASTKLFTLPERWEPGAVAYENLTVANVGNLALKYELAVNAINETVVDGHSLKEALKVAVVEGGFNGDRDAAKTLTYEEFDSFALRGELEAGDESNVYGIVVYWAPSANDNIFNMNNENQGKVLTVDLGVKLVATQLDAEQDSFGDDYDANAMVSYVEDGVKYSKNVETGDVMLVGITEDFVGDTLNVPAGVTALASKVLQGDTQLKEVTVPVTVIDFGGTPNAAGTGASGGFFYKSAVEKVTLPEGMTQIPVAAFNQAANLKEVNIPASVTTIGINAFAGSGLETLTIPKTVTSIGYGAFRDMNNLETVIIKGNVKIPAYAFRSCANLTTAYLMGDNVTFENGMIFSNYDTGLNDGLTVYVANETVKARLEAADSSAQYYTIAVMQALETSDALKDAVNSNQAVVQLAAGEFDFPTSSNIRDKTLIITGTKDTVIDMTAVNENNQFVTGATMVFDGVTLNFGTANYMGLANTASLTYKNCTINGVQHLYGPKIVAENCTFNVEGDFYSIRTWGAQNATFNNCTFNSDGKAVLLYGTANTKLTMNNCVFNDKGGLTDLKAAIEIGDDYGKSYELIVNNATVNGYEINDQGYNTGSTLWANKKPMDKDHLNVVIDGVDVY